MKKRTNSSSAKLPANKSRGPDFDETSNKNPIEERTNKTPVKPTISKSKKSGFNESDDKGKIFSTDYQEMCKQRCEICLTERLILADHVPKAHQTSIQDYRQLYGMLVADYTNLVYHKCGVCEKRMVFDYKIVQNHVRYRHKLLRFKEYKEINFELY